MVYYNSLIKKFIFNYFDYFCISYLATKGTVFVFEYLQSSPKKRAKKRGRIRAFKDKISLKTRKVLGFDSKTKNLMISNDQVEHDLNV